MPIKAAGCKTASMKALGRGKARLRPAAYLSILEQRAADIDARREHDREEAKGER